MHVGVGKALHACMQAHVCRQSRDLHTFLRGHVFVQEPWYAGGVELVLVFLLYALGTDHPLFTRHRTTKFHFR